MAVHHVEVGPIPDWIDHDRLLGPTGAGEPWQRRGPTAEAQLASELAADLAARLRGLGLDGHPIVCSVDPPLKRPLVRRARTEDARRRRSTTPGFERSDVALDEEGRWSLTPERLALAIARRAGQAPIVDAGCGLGGNAIAFARTGCRVVAIDADRDRLELARHNAEVYQVEDRIRFVHGDAIEAALEYADPRALLFVDPPWGVDWNREVCGLAELPLLAQLLSLAGPRFAGVWAKVPPSFATMQVAQAESEAVFGEAPGDHRRVKFLLLRVPPIRRRDNPSSVPR